MTAPDGIQIRDSLESIGDETLECRAITVAHAPPSRPTLVFLHEGLGSVAMWRRTPEEMCRAAGCSGLVYSRMGYGGSTQLAAPRPVQFMEREADLVLPRLLEVFAIERPLLIGHSDGASIALLYASRADSLAVGTLAMAPHLFVEEIALKAIAATRDAYLAGPLRERLKPYHRDVDGAFFGWNDIWLDAEFAKWDVTVRIKGVRCPVAAVQGEEDEYGTMAQVEAVLHAVGNARAYRLADCRHSPHRDQPQAVNTALRSLLVAAAR